MVLNLCASVYIRHNIDMPRPEKSYVPPFVVLVTTRRAGAYTTVQEKVPQNKVLPNA